MLAQKMKPARRLGYYNPPVNLGRIIPGCDFSFGNAAFFGISGIYSAAPPLLNHAAAGRRRSDPANIRFVFPTVDRPNIQHPLQTSRLVHGNHPQKLFILGFLGILYTKKPVCSINMKEK
jgi:hypothetical protein